MVERALCGRKDVQSVAVVFPRLELGLTAVRLNVQPTEQLLLPIICHYLAHLSDNLSGQSSLPRDFPRSHAGGNLLPLLLTLSLGV
jgi:hypothetical protein